MLSGGKDGNEFLLAAGTENLWATDEYACFYPGDFVIVILHEKICQSFMFCTNMYFPE